MRTRRAKSKERIEKLALLLQGQSSLLIVMQDNPDPDAIASAAALRRLANHLAGIQCSIAYGGVIGRGENRAVADYLGLNFRAFSAIDLDRFDVVALVDSQPGAGNNALPAERRPDIVLDHHPLQPSTRGLPFVDVRSRYGALATVLFEYLDAAGIMPGPPLATALLYGIRSDTQDLGQQASQADIEAVEALYSLANTRMLSAIQRGRVDHDYFRTVFEALRRARLQGNVIFSAIGELTIPDMTGELADWLLRHRDVRWVLCWGLHEGKLWLSLRSTQSQPHAGQLMRDLVDGLGSGGGHPMSAGGQIPLLEQGQRHVEAIITRRLMTLTGVVDQPCQPLVG